MGKANYILLNKIAIILFRVTCQMTHCRCRVNKYENNVTMNTKIVLHSMSIK